MTIPLITVFAKISYLANVQSNVKGAGVAVLWGSTAATLMLARAGARRLAQLAAPVERVLVVGSSAARALLASSLGSDPGARVQVVGFLPLENKRLIATEWGARSRRRQQLTFEDLAWVVRALEVDRVFLIPTNADEETMLEAARRTAALGITVSIVPRLSEVVGSAVAFDTVGGVTVLGIRRPANQRLLIGKRGAPGFVGHLLEAGDPRKVPRQVLGTPDLSTVGG